MSSGGRKIRVATLFRTLGTGGDENRLLAFARAVDHSRFEHIVVIERPTPPQQQASDGPMLAEYRQAGIEVVFLESEPEYSGAPRSKARIALDTARLALRFSKWLREHRIDVIDARLVAAIPLAVIAGSLAGTPGIVGTQYLFDLRGRPVRRVFFELCWPLLDALICDSQARLDEMRALLLLPPPGEMIPNGIEAPTSERSPAEMRALLGLPASPDIQIVAQLSRLVRFKGQRVLVEAAAAVLQRAPNTHFLICGFAREAGFREELQQRAEALGIARSVTILPYPGPIGDVWQAVDLHVHASLYDSSPIAILEGMSLGKPAVVTDSGGIPELVSHDQTGWIVPMNDPQALADGIVMLLQSPATAHRLGAAARARYLSLYRPETMVAAHEALFERLAGQKGGFARRIGRALRSAFDSAARPVQRTAL